MRTPEEWIKYLQRGDCDVWLHCNGEETIRDEQMLMIAAVQREAIEECISTIESELEYPTPWPYEKLVEFRAIINERADAIQALVRSAVSCTKESLVTRIRALVPHAD